MSETSRHSTREGAQPDTSSTLVSSREPEAIETEGSPSLQKLASGSILTTGGIIANGVLGFLLVVVVTRGVGPTGAGAFFQSVGLFTILVSLADFGAIPGLVRTIARYRALGRHVDIRRVVAIALWPIAAVSLAAGVILFALAPYVASLLGLDPALGIPSLRVLAAFLPVASLSSVTLAATRGFGRMLPYVALENLAKPALRPLFVALVIGAGFGTTAMLAAWATPAALILVPAAVTAATLIRKGERGQSPQTSVRSLAKEFWSFAAPRGVASVFQMAILWLDVILVGALRSTEEAGIYAAVSRLISLGIFAIEGVRLAIAPQLSSALARDDRIGAQLLYRVGTWWLVAASWPMYLTLVVFPGFILRLFGPEFVSGESALVIVSLSMLVGVGTGNVTVVLLMGGKSVWNLWNTSAALAVNVVLNLILIPSLGMVGAAIAWSASLLVVNLLPLVQVWRFLHISPFGRGFLIVTAASTVCFGVLGIAVRETLGSTAPAFLLFAATATISYVWLLFRYRRHLYLNELKEAILARTGRRRRRAQDNRA